MRELWRAGSPTYQETGGIEEGGRWSCSAAFGGTGGSMSLHGVAISYHSAGRPSSSSPSLSYFPSPCSSFGSCSSSCAATSSASRRMSSMTRSAGPSDAQLHSCSVRATALHTCWWLV